MEYFRDAIVNGVPLLFVVFGLTAWLKSMGLGGRALTASAFGIGIVAGVLFQYSLTPLAGFTAWFGAAVYGLGLGVVASGVYKGIENATGKAAIEDAVYLDLLGEDIQP